MPHREARGKAAKKRAGKEMGLRHGQTYSWGGLHDGE